MNFRTRLTSVSLTILLLVTIQPARTLANDSTSLNDIIQFARLEEGRALLTTPDAFTAKWSEFDIVSRAQDAKGTVDQVLDMASEQVLSWTNEEVIRIKEVIADIDTIISRNGFQLPLPEQVMLVKSTLAEEAGAQGYTRENYIVLRQDLIFREDDMLKDILLHELFHIMSRHDAEFRKEVYEVIGFTVCNPVEYPSSIADLKITNPDAPSNDSYITLATLDSIPVDCVLMLYAKKPWEGGTFATYLQLGFAAVEGDEGEKTVRSENGVPEIYNIGQVIGFLDQVGWNTQYVIDPEEICADNFSFVFDENLEKPTPGIIESIKEILLPD